MLTGTATDVFVATVTDGDGHFSRRTRCIRRADGLRTPAPRPRRLRDDPGGGRRGEPGDTVKVGAGTFTESI